MAKYEERKVEKWLSVDIRDLWVAGLWTYDDYG
jgi:hypothetical protein